MVFLFILLILSILLLLIITAKIKVEIKELKIRSKKEYLKNKYDIRIKIGILGFLPIFCLKINKRKIEKLKRKNRFKNIKLNKISKTKLKHIKEQIQVNIKNLYFNLNIGTESTIVTTILIPVISTIVGVLLANKNVKLQKQKFTINPIYNIRKYIRIRFFRYI